MITFFNVVKDGGRERKGESLLKRELKAAQKSELEEIPSLTEESE